MTQDEIISMMKEAGFYIGKDDEFHPEWERFVALVAAHFQKKLDYAHQTIFAFEQKLAVRGYENQIASLEQALSEAVLAEREECAKVCEDIDTEYEGEDVLATWCAAAIRSRSQS